MSIIQWASKVKDIKNLINYNPSKEIQQVLEPLSCMIRLAMLYYKPEKTKISISNNRIYFQTKNIRILRLYNILVFKLSNMQEYSREFTDIIYFVKDE